MTIIIEIGPPFQSKPGKFKNSIMTRYWWLWFAVSWLHIPFRDFATTPHDWERA